MKALNYQHQLSTEALCLRLHVTLTLSKEGINFVFHSLSPSTFIYYLPRTLLALGFVVHLLGQCSLTADSRWNIFGSTFMQM